MIDFSIRKTIPISLVFHTIWKKNLWLNTYIYYKYTNYIWYECSINHYVHEFQWVRATDLRQSASMKNEVTIKIAECTWWRSIPRLKHNGYKRDILIRSMRR